MHIYKKVLGQKLLQRQSYNKYVARRKGEKERFLYNIQKSWLHCYERCMQRQQLMISQQDSGLSSDRSCVQSAQTS